MNSLFCLSQRQKHELTPRPWPVNQAELGNRVPQIPRGGQTDARGERAADLILCRSFSKLPGRQILHTAVIWVSREGEPFTMRPSVHQEMPVGANEMCRAPCLPSAGPHATSPPSTWFRDNGEDTPWTRPSLHCGAKNLLVSSVTYRTKHIRRGHWSSWAAGLEGKKDRQVRSRQSLMMPGTGHLGVGDLGLIYKWIWRKQKRKNWVSLGRWVAGDKLTWRGGLTVPGREMAGAGLGAVGEPTSGWL